MGSLPVRLWGDLVSASGEFLSARGEFLLSALTCHMQGLRARRIAHGSKPPAALTLPLGGQKQAILRH
jgi:hypothetical protein